MKGDADPGERVTTGNKELDEMLGGGIPARHVVVLAGPAGAGKTITTLQFMWANLQAGKRCMFVSASDDDRAILENAKKFGWDLKPYIDSKSLILLKLKLVEVEHGLVSDLQQQLPKLIRQAKPDILVVDSITEFDDLCASDLERRGRLLYLREVIKEIGATAIITAEADTARGGMATKYGIAEYVADGFILHSRFLSEDYSQLLYVIQIMKMRWTGHSKETRAYNITSKGIQISSPLYTILATSGKQRV
jgi:KaiC/GvpD/RAD55 family RecA-like ATPase